MPTKNKVQKLKQKQRQSQSVKVVVNLAEKRKRKRKSKPRAKAQEKEAEVVSYKAFPPQIIYPSPPVVFSNFEAKAAPPISLAQTVTEKVKQPAGILEDIGNIGTEGVGVEILDRPTKRETLAELQTPVGVNESEQPIPMMIRAPKKSLTLAQTLKEKLPATMTEDLFMPQPELVVEPMAEPIVELATPAQPKKKGGRPKKSQEADNKQRLLTEFFKVAKAKNIPDETLQRYDEVYKFNQKSNKKITQLISKIRKNQNVTDQFLNDTLNELFN
jgi:hypothetical protein